MTKTKLFFLIIALFISNPYDRTSQTIQQQITEIGMILKNPIRYQGATVSVRGTVIQLVPVKKIIKYYVLKSDFGASIKIRIPFPATLPETYKKYFIKGVVNFDIDHVQPVITEISRQPVEGNTPAITDTSVKHDQSNISQIKPAENTKNDHTIIYLICGVAVVLIIVILFYIKNRRKPNLIAQQNFTNIDSNSSNIFNDSSPTLKVDVSAFSTTDDFKTIKIVLDSPKTLKLIPGKLEIVSGEDKGKSFKIAGHPSSEGSIVTIGREEVNGEFAYSHIQLKQKTISRKQAELIYKESKLFIKNLSETNYTMLDGIELKTGQAMELKSGSIIKTGEVEFSYNL